MAKSEGNGALKTMLDFLFPCRPSLFMPCILALGVSSSFPHQIHLSMVTLDLVTTLIKIFQYHPAVDYLAEYTGDLGLKSPSHHCLWAADLGPLRSTLVP